jgi:hypothetical protein
MTVVSNLDDFRALDPFFRIIERGVAGLVDGEHFFDLLAEDVIVDYVITVPGYPRRVEGRHAVAELYRPYGATIVLDRHLTSKATLLADGLLRAGTDGALTPLLR